MKRTLPSWLSPPPAWLWPRNVSTVPNGLQRLGRVLHWGLSSLAVFLAGFSILVIVGATFAWVKSASWELVGYPVPRDLRTVEMRLETPFKWKPAADRPARLTDQEVRAEVSEYAQEMLRRGLAGPDEISDIKRIASEAATSDWKVTRRSTPSTKAKERALTRTRARIELKRAKEALPDAITTALALILGALGSALGGRATRYVISGE
jgi:hypothetical protein